MRHVLLKKSLLFAGVLFTSLSSMAQVTQKWVQRENGDPADPDVANDLTLDKNNNVIVTGWSGGKGSGLDYATIKYNDDGDSKWVKRYNGPGNGDDRAIAIENDTNCNVLVTGWSTGCGTGADFATIKYDADGNAKWVKRFNGMGNGADQPTDIAVDESGNVYVTGWSTGSGTRTDFTTIKYDKDGNTKWVRSYNGSANGNDQPTAIAVDKNGNVYVTGWSTNTGTGEDYTTIKYDKNGVQQWVNRYNGPVDFNDRANALALDNNGNIYVTGFIATSLPDIDQTYYSDVATIKYNPAGLQQYAAISNFRQRDVANAIAVDASGNAYITGVAGFEDEDSDDKYITVKYNAAGVQLWGQVFTDLLGESSKAEDLVLDAAGNVYVTGRGALGIYDLGDYVTNKYNTNGVQQWVAVYDGPENGPDIAHAIGLDQKGNVYVTGQSNFNFDYATIKYNNSGVQKWVRRYNGPGELQLGGADVANALAVDSHGNVHVTGGISRFNTGLDYTTFKYETADGDRIWKKTYSGPGIGPDVANAIALDANGNVYATGRSFGIGTLADFATVKYDAAGNSQWGKRYNGPANLDDQANAITVDNKGFVYVTGFSRSPSATTVPNPDYLTIKYKDNGDVVWIRRYNGPGNATDIANDIFVDANGNVYVTGGSSANGASTDYTTIKYDANGNELWVARYDGPLNFSDDANALVVDASGNVYVTGESFGIGTSIDYATVKYNAAGVQQWVQRFATPGGDQARDIGLDASGNVYVTGFSSGDYATIKYSNAGVQQWAAIHPGNFGFGATALAIDPAANVYVTGGASPGPGIPDDYLTLKYNTFGAQLWEIRYNGPGNGSDIANDVKLDAAGNVYVTGSSTGNRTLTDYATIKYVQATLVTCREETIPHLVTTQQASAKLAVKAFPNAFTQYINLQWSGNDKPVNMTITDEMGRLVEKRTGLASSGTVQTGSSFGKGIYFAEIVQGEEKIVLKLVKQ